MHDTYLGLCLKSHADGAFGKIRPVGRLARDSENRWLQDFSFDIQEFGPSGSVFWFNRPLDPRPLDGSLVLFTTETSKNYGQTDSWKSWYQVCRRAQDGWDVDPAPFPLILSETAATELAELPEGAQVYIHRRLAKQLVGPYYVAEEHKEANIARRLHPCFPGLVRVFKRSEIPAESLLEWDDKGATRECLLNEPDLHTGEVEDAATPEELASWLVQSLHAYSESSIPVLDELCAGWCKSLKSAIPEMSDPVKRELARQRLERLEQAILSLRSQEEAFRKLVLEHPHFRAELEQAIQSEVQNRQEEVLQKVKQRHAEFLANLQVEEVRLGGELESLREQLGAYERLDAVRQEVDRCNEELAKRRSELAEIDARADRMEQAARHLEEAKCRLVCDYLGFESILQSYDAEVVATAEPGSGHLEPDGDPIVDPGRFLVDRLEPYLSRWVPDLTSAQAKALHLAILACRWVLVPDPGWAKAYVEAMGGTARLELVTVEPTWLRFRDAWKGPVGQAWHRAKRETDLLHLLVFVDLNRSLPQCWVRPWLDLLSGYRDTLPPPAGVVWPANLRVLGTVAEDSANYPLEIWVVRHWAALPRKPLSGERLGGGNSRPGHVRFDDWQAWIGREMGMADATIVEACRCCGPAARAASCEVGILERLTAQLGITNSFVRKIRLDWPLDYVEAPADELR